MKPETLAKVREEFEAWMRSRHPHKDIWRNEYDGPRYAAGETEGLWEAWMARTEFDTFPERVEESADARQVPEGFSVHIDPEGDVRVAQGGTSIWLRESDEFNQVVARLIRALLPVPKPAVNEQKKIPDITKEWVANMAAAEGDFDITVGGAKPCPLPPNGWYCTRGEGHEGPCAAHRVAHKPQSVSDNGDGGEPCGTGNHFYGSVDAEFVETKCSYCGDELIQPANKTPDSYTGQEGRVQISDAMVDRAYKAWRWRVLSDDETLTNKSAIRDALTAALSEKKT